MPGLYHPSFSSPLPARNPSLSYLTSRPGRGPADSAPQTGACRRSGPGWELGGHVRATPAPVVWRQDRGPTAPTAPRPEKEEGRRRARAKSAYLTGWRGLLPSPRVRAGGSAPGPLRSPGWRRPTWRGALRPSSAVHRKPAPVNMRPFYNPFVTHNRPGAFSVKPPASPPSCLFLEPTARKTFFLFKGKVEKAQCPEDWCFPLSLSRGSLSLCVFSLDTRCVLSCPRGKARTPTFVLNEKETHSNARSLRRKGSCYFLQLGGGGVFAQPSRMRKKREPKRSKWETCLPSGISWRQERPKQRKKWSSDFSM